MWRICGNVHELKEALFYRTNKERPETEVSHQQISVTRENPKRCLEVMCFSCSCVIRDTPFSGRPVSYTCIPLINSELDINISGGRLDT